jgi:hypothetical protein
MRCDEALCQRASGNEMGVGTSGLPSQNGSSHISFINREVQLLDTLYTPKPFQLHSLAASLRPNPKTRPPEAPRIHHSLVVPAHRIIGQHS